MSSSSPPSSSLPDNNDNSNNNNNGVIPDEASDCMYYEPHFLTQEQATLAYHELHTSMKWEKTNQINRWVCLLQQDENCTGDIDYRYRDDPTNADDANADGTSTSNNFPPLVRQLAQQAQEWYRSNHHHKSTPDDGNIDFNFNVCLLNFYQDGQQRLGWHADREEIGRSTPIASVSLGAERTFGLQKIQSGSGGGSNSNHNKKWYWTLEHGSLLVMEPECQTRFLHSVPRMNDLKQGRINLTFRCKRPGDTTAGEELHQQRRREQQQQQNMLWSANENHGEVVLDQKDDSDTVVFGDAFATTRSSSSQSNDQRALLELLEQSTEPRPMIWAVKTNIGMECYAAQEVKEVLNLACPVRNGNDLDEDDDDDDDDNTVIKHPWTIVPRPWNAAGYVLAVSTEKENKSTATLANKETSKEALLTLRSALAVLEYHDHFDLSEVVGDSNNSHNSDDNHTENDKSCNVKNMKGTDLYQFYKDRLERGTVQIPTLQQSQSLEPNAASDRIPFRVTCERLGGPQGFQAPDVEYEMGGALDEYYSQAQPRMKGFHVHIRIDVIHTVVLVGTQHNTIDLSRQRDYLVGRYRNIVTIKTNLAYAMLRCANLLPTLDLPPDPSSPRLLLDPFCGSGTILLEALSVDPNLQGIGLDVNRRSVQGAQANARAAGLNEDRCSFHCTDVRALRKHVLDQSVDAIVSNLPWGIMTGQHQSVHDLQSMYEMFLRTAWYVLKNGGRVVLLVLRGLFVTRLVRKLGGRYRLLRANVVRTSNNLPTVIVLEKLTTDVWNQSIKQQLSYMSQFVNVSKEIYHTIHNQDIAEGTDAPTARNQMGHSDDQD